MLRLARLVAALVAALLPPGPALAVPDVDALRAVVDAAIRPVIARHDLPGIAVGVTIEGRSFFFNYGVSSRETNEPVDETTIFELGSISKTFTATLAAVAQARGDLSLADHPSRHMPQLEGVPIDRATLLELGTYTAGGLPLQFPGDVTDGPGMVRYFQRWRPDARPGVLRRYSNPSIGLLGHVTALAMGREFGEAIEAELLPKLGLGHTHVRVPERAMPDYAWGYDDENRPVRVNPGVFDAEAYGVKSTAADMIRYVQLSIDASGLDETTRRAIEATHVGHFKVGAMAQGLGWEQYRYPVSLKALLAGNSSDILFEPAAVKHIDGGVVGPRLFNKTGSTRGFGAYVAFVPQQRIGIVMLANRSYPIADRLRAAHAILGWLAKPTR